MRIMRQHQLQWFRNQNATLRKSNEVLTNSSTIISLIFNYNILYNTIQYKAHVHLYASTLTNTHTYVCLYDIRAYMYVLCMRPGIFKVKLIYSHDKRFVCLQLIIEEMILLQFKLITTQNDELHLQHLLSIAERSLQLFGK